MSSDLTVVRSDDRPDDEVMNLTATQSAPVVKVPHTCGDCGTEYLSFARFLTLDPCHKAKRDAQSARFLAGLEGSSPAEGSCNVDAPERHDGTGSASRRYVEAPTAKQIEWLTKFGIEIPAAKQAASVLLDVAFKANPKNGAAAVKRNRFAGSCSRCHGEVAAEAGTLTRTAGGQWVVSHDEGQCGLPVDPTARPATIVLPEVPEGHYAIESNGHNDLLFVRVDRPTEGKWAGRTFVKMIVGGHPDAAIRGAHAKSVLERIVAAGVEAAATRYGVEIGRCHRCNRELTDELSRSLGIGPDCRKKA